MKIRRIPAQITTVEDKIAGNLSFIQMVLLVIPVFVVLIGYSSIPPVMHFSLLKIILMVSIGIVPPILSIRIKEHIILSWIGILLRYNLRPKYYVFNKNDAHLREMDIIPLQKKQVKAHVHSQAKSHIKHKALSFGELVKLEDLLANPKYTFSIKSHKKGAFHVAIEQK